MNLHLILPVEITDYILRKIVTGNRFVFPCKPNTFFQDLNSRILFKLPLCKPTYVPNFCIKYNRKSVF